MKRSLFKAVAAIAVTASSALVGTLAVIGEADAAVTGIRNTRHFLGSTAPAGNNRFSGTDEVCVFCHTPHGAATGGGNPPLWNKNLPTGPYTVYSTANSSTMDAALATDGAGGGAIGSVSIACLSCHDGTQAMNSVINAPGSGLTNAAYTAGTWTAGTGPTPVNTANGQLGTGIANLGTDLSNDHPIGIQYCGGGINGSTGAGSCRDTDFVAPTSTVISGTRVFWVDADANGVRNKTDMILYNRDFGATATPAGVGPSVECASCHDPHTDANPTFLRRTNTASGVCLACHVK
jgi:predicted CXXCH cytochrome family protein